MEKSNGQPAGFRQNGHRDLQAGGAAVALELFDGRLLAPEFESVIRAGKGALQLGDQTWQRSIRKVLPVW